MTVSYRAVICTMAAVMIATLGPVTAQQVEPAPKAPALRDIPLDEWMDRTLGRTVYYTIDGAAFGREYYAPDGQGVVFQHVDGTCMEGEWFYREEASAYCFIWPLSLSCFRHVDRNEETLILAVDPDGTPTGDLPQRVERIATVPLSCGPAVTS